MIENCIRCGRPTPYDQSTPIHLRCYYVEGSSQLCEQCFSQLYPRTGSAQPSVSSSSAPSLTPTILEQGDKDEGKQIKTINLEKGRMSTLPDQDRYNQLINKTTLTDADREEMTRLYKKYTE